MDDEPGLGIVRGGMAGFFGLDPNNALPGNVVKAALMASIYNLKTGVDELDRQSLPRNRMVLTGGLTRTPDLAQILADVFATPVELPPGSAEGTAVGSACLAKFRHGKIHGTAAGSWTDFLAAYRRSGNPVFTPRQQEAAGYRAGYEKYQRLVSRIVDLTA
jgi:xylulokinase